MGREAGSAHTPHSPLLEKFQIFFLNRLRPTRLVLINCPYNPHPFNLSWNPSSNKTCSIVSADPDKPCISAELSGITGDPRESPLWTDLAMISYGLCLFFIVRTWLRHQCINLCYRKNCWAFASKSIWTQFFNSWWRRLLVVSAVIKLKVAERMF